MSQHPRQLIREHIARELVRRGAWDSAIFVSRRTPIDQDDHFPNLCIYTPSERTESRTNDDTRKQELQVVVEVRTERVPDMVRPWHRVDGLPAHPALSHPAPATLDEACWALEQVVFSIFGRPARLVLQGTPIDIDGITEVNTDLNGSADGEVPYELAIVEFRVVYWVCVPALEPDACPLTTFYGAIQHVPCTEPPAEPVPASLLVQGAAPSEDCAVSVKAGC